MKRIGLALALIVVVGLALRPGASWADGFKGKGRAFVRPGQVSTFIGRKALIVQRPFFFRHPGFHRTFIPPFAVVDPGLTPAPPVVINILAGPPNGSDQEATPPPVQPKMITVNPG